MDSEWRPTMTTFDDTIGPALLQLSDKKTAFLIDLNALSGNKELDDMLTQIFTNEHTLCIGFAFKSDMDAFGRHFPTMSFY